MNIILTITIFILIIAVLFHISCTQDKPKAVQAEPTQQTEAELMAAIIADMPDPPKPGDRWVLNDGDPFPPLYFLCILETKDDWVRYTIGGCEMRMPIRRLMADYRIHEPAG